MQKHRKFNPKKRPKNGKPKPKGEGEKKGQGKPSWKPVQISGPVIADDGADFGGFIGLEVMENYDDFVRNEKVVLDDDMEFGNTKKKPKRKRGMHSDSDESETEMEVYSREKNLKVPKLTMSAFLESTEDDSGFDDIPKKKNNEKPDSKKVDLVEKVERTESAKSSSKAKETSLKPRETVKLEKELKSRENVEAKSKVDEEEAEPSKPFSMLLKPPKQKEKMKKQVSKKQGEKAEAQQSFSSADYISWIELGVSEPIVKALADKGFKVPTEIQSKSLPVAILGCRDLLGAAETGSGKTLAFGIPMLEGIMKLKQQDELTCVEDHRSSDHELTPPPEDMDDMPEDVRRVFATEGSKLQSNRADPNKPLYGLILTPTRELAVQINDHLKAVAKYTGINIATVFGGLAAVKQERLLRKCPEIVIATPGRLWELIQGGNAHLTKVAQIRFLVIDETDRMLEKGHFEELKQLLELINSNEEAKNRRRNYIFSATLTMDHDLPEHLMKNAKKAKKVIKETPGMRMNNLIQVVGMTDPKIVDLTQDHGTAHTLTESRIVCSAEQKDYFLYYFLERHPGRTLVFCNSIDCVKRLVSLLDYLNCSPLSLFGSMQQQQRLKNLERFTANPKALLVATDVAARGLDIPNVDHVIHYQVPKTTENYVHRSGRTARASREGLALLLISPAEMKDYVKLNQNLGRSEDLPLYPTSDRMMRQIKLRVNLAREIERMDLQQRRTGAERSWQDKLEQEFQNDSDVDSEQEELRKIEQSKWKRGFKAKRLELSKMLAAPLFMERKVEMRFPTSHLALTPKQDTGKSAINLVREAEQERIAATKRRGKKKQN
ncbi:ATP-dependent RNA helicase ddx24 [Anopheles ziemanni]|uniref:ATP-dependent RNA helicase ddx24 n=1 Tax=Anopheles coustani TaxID=139045 RepID=UPI00265A4227|nr:ATP-dependent RNA helicase ddx24 [Anopheles coustani]XP_058170354.1 ATP-dependent RNA helicase ddx24 [Anopheles ziemanni]